MYFTDAPVNLGQLHGKALDRPRRGTGDGRPLPGGDLLVLLGNGSEGLSDDRVTYLDDDPSSVAFSLGFWEELWRIDRGEPRERTTHRPNVIVRQAVSYLEPKMRWAAREQRRFGEFFDDLRELHARLERATGQGVLTVRAEAECFRCGAELVRELRDGKACQHTSPPPWPPAFEVTKDDRLRRRPTEEVRAEYADALEQWETEHGRCRSLGGYADSWTCQRCGDTYDWQRYLLAVGQRLRQEDVPGWGLPEQVGHVLGVNPRTVKSWAERGLVTTACVLSDSSRRMRVWWDDARVRAEKLHEERARRLARREAS